MQADNFISQDEFTSRQAAAFFNGHPEKFLFDTDVWHKKQEDFEEASKYGDETNKKTLKAEESGPLMQSLGFLIFIVPS